MFITLNSLNNRLREVIFKDTHNLTFNDAQIDFNDTQFV